MRQPPTTALQRATTATFESLALLFPELLPGDAHANISFAAIVNVTFRGADSGRVIVGVTADVLTALTENMLGASSLPDARVQRDALGELANVVTGNLLPLVYGAAPVFRLDAPADATVQSFHARSGEALAATVRVHMDEGEAFLALVTNAVPPTADEPMLMEARSA
jgi:CheY-specific phosphatase CheX